MSQLLKITLLSISLILIFQNVESISNKFQLAKQLHLAIQEKHSIEIARLLKEGANPYLRIQYFISTWDAFEIAMFYQSIDFFRIYTLYREQLVVQSLSSQKISYVYHFIVFVFILSSTCCGLIFWKKGQMEKEEGEHIVNKTQRELESSKRKQKDLELQVAILKESVGNISETEETEIKLSKVEELQARLEDETEQKRCVICLENMKNAAFSCGHVFCSECCEEILSVSAKCPICKKEDPTILNLYGL